MEKTFRETMSDDLKLNIGGGRRSEHPENCALTIVGLALDFGARKAESRNRPATRAGNGFPGAPVTLGA